VATNLGNLEYSSISLNIENSGNSHGILCNLREKNLNNKVFLVHHSNICVKHGQSVVVTCYIAGVDVE